MSAVPAELVIGCRVKVPTKNLEGIVHFVGATKFASGKWVGIELGVSALPFAAQHHHKHIALRGWPR